MAGGSAPLDVLGAARFPRRLATQNQFTECTEGSGEPYEGLRLWLGSGVLEQALRVSEFCSQPLFNLPPLV
jgi:hypothetical protein